MEQNRILIIDDDQDMRNLIENTLEVLNVQVFTAASGKEGLYQFYKHKPDLVILDNILTDMDGREICLRIRCSSDTPILMLSGLNKVDDMVIGLNLGADDYMAKPFSPKLLVARVRAALRRREWTDENPSQAIYEDDYLRIDLNKHLVQTQNNPISLTPTEYKLLSYLLYNADSVLTYRQILDNVWDRKDESEYNQIHVYISQLRRKLEKDPKAPQYIITEHGTGYRFNTKFPALP